MTKDHKGFTLIELISVITILSILIILVLPNITKYSETSKSTLKDSKIRTIESAAEKYSNDRINDFQKCLGTEAINEKSCKVSIDTLIQKGYLAADDETSNIIIDPKTDEVLKGDILICYDPLAINTYASYSENNDYSCGSVDVEMGNSFRLSSTNGEAYINGVPVEVNIIKGGTFDEENPFECSSSTSLVTCSIDVSKNLLILTPSDTPISDSSGEAIATIKVNGNYAGGKLSAEYKLKIKNTHLSIQDIIPYCLKTDQSYELPLDLLNNGRISIKPTDPNIMDGHVKGQKLFLATGNKTGASNITLIEDNGNRSANLEKNVYKLQVGHIPDTIILGLKETVELDYGGTGPLEITSSNPTAILIESENQRESGSITLNANEKKFTLVAKAYTKEPVTITIRGMNGCGVFTSEVTVDNTRLNIIDETDTCMEVGTERTLTLDTLNAGKISINSSMPDTLDASIIDDRLKLFAKDVPARATITLRENNSNKTASVTKDVYKFKIGEISTRMVLGKIQPVAIDFGGLGTLKITSSNPDIVALSTSSQSSRGEITLTPSDESFNLIAKAHSENEQVEITITSENNCIEKHFYTEVSDFKLSSTSGTLYIGGAPKTITIDSDNAHNLSCISSDRDIARCNLKDDKLTIEPWKTEGTAIIQVINEAGTKVEYTATVLDIDLKIVDPNKLDYDGNPSKIETVCNLKGTSTNSNRIKIEGKNYGDLSVIIEEDLLADATIYKENDRDFINISGKYLSGSYNSYKPGYNTGRTLVTVKEEILKKTDKFNYYVYSLETREEKINLKVNETKEFIIEASNTGKLSISSSNPEVAEANIIDDDIVNFGTNVIDKKIVQVAANGVGKTTLTIKGVICGTITIDVEVEGKEYSIKISPGKYTTTMKEQTLSCITEGTNKGCDITLPEIPFLEGKSEPVGYFMEDDSLEFTYVQNSKITLTEAFNNFTLYANSRELIAPHCLSTISEELIYNNIDQIYTIDVICIDNESGISDEILLNKDGFYISNFSGEVVSITDPNKLENGISFKIEVKSKEIGLYDLVMPAGLVKDKHGNINQYTVLGNFSAYEYEPVDIINIGIPDPYDEDVGNTTVSSDVVAVLYRNRDILKNEEDDTYTLKLYGKNSGTMIDFMSESFPEFPKWTLDEYIDEELNIIDYKNKITNLVISDGIKNVGDYLMYGVTNLKSVELPEGITYIGAAAFASTALESVNVPSSVIEIGSKAFENVPLKTLTLKEQLTKISNNSFFNNKLIDLQIPSNVQSIGSYAFYQPGNIYLKTLSIMDGSELVELGEYAFPDLSVIEINLPNEIESLDPFKRKEQEQDSEASSENT